MWLDVIQLDVDMDVIQLSPWHLKKLKKIFFQPITLCVVWIDLTAL